MNWLAGWDFPSRTASAWPTPLAQMIFALLITIALILLRMAIDLVAPSAGPLALLYPAVMIATLFGRWLAGAITLLLSVAYTIYFNLPPAGSFALDNASDGPRLVVNVSTLVIMIVLAELFRSAIMRANAERDRQIEARELLLRELDHRVKNNFASVAGLLQLQAQRATDPVVREQLGIALNRVESIATAHRFLYREGASSGEVEMASYLGDLCDALAAALIRSDRVELHCVAESIPIPRDRAISIGLIVNELVTNAVRHAFPEDRSGTIRVCLRNIGDGIELSVEDDGCGMSSKQRDGSLGRRLIAAFVRQANGELSTESSAAGTRCAVRMA